MKKWLNIILIIIGVGLIVFGVFIMFIVFPLDLVFIEVDMSANERIFTITFMFVGLILTLIGAIRLRRNHVSQQKSDSNEVK